MAKFEIVSVGFSLSEPCKVNHLLFQPHIRYTSEAYRQPSRRWPHAHIGPENCP